MGYSNYETKTKKGFNYFFVAKIIGHLFGIQVIFLLIAMGISQYYEHDNGFEGLMYTAIIALTLSIGLLLLGRRSKEFDTGRRESLFTVAVSWFLVSLVGMLPYIISGAIPNWADALFETISGYSTTGATILPDIEALPNSLLFWRSVTHFIGGLGVVVFLVAIIPMTGDDATKVYASEASGVTGERFVARTGVMAKWVMIIYFGLNVICTLLLWLGPMSLFDAFCHSASAVSTGGFSTKNTSIAYFESYYVDLVLSIFMIFGSVSFTMLYFVFIRGELKKLTRNSELKWFISMIFIFALISTLWLLGSGIKQDPFEAFWKSLVQVISLISTTGFAVEDYNLWGGLFVLIAISVMFIAGCSGSTSGGLKMVRFVVLFKNMMNEMKKRVHPQAVYPVKLNGSAIPEKVVESVKTYFFAFIFLGIIGTFVVATEGYTFTESISTAIACVANAGPAFGAFGPIENYSALSNFTKVVLSILMVVGRLEIFTVLALFHRSFWKI